jgi:hypothetical protein
VTLGREVGEPDGAKGDAIARAVIKYGKNRTLDITGMTTTQQQKLIEAFLETMQRDAGGSAEEIDS